MRDPAVESLPIAEQTAVDEPLYRDQLARLFAQSRFYRDKLEAAGIGNADRAGGLDNIASLPFTEKDELRASRSDADPIGTHLAVPMRTVARIFSTSGTTGTPSYIPLTTRDLGDWIRISSRTYSASGISSGDGLISTYNAGPFVAGVTLDAFGALGLRHIPVGSGNTERLMAALRMLKPDAIALTPSYALHLAEWADARGIDLRALPRRPPPCRRRTGRRRAGAAGAARGDLGCARHRGDGHRRHRRFPLGRVRASGTACTSAAAVSSISS